MPKNGFTNLTVDDERITKARIAFDRIRPQIEQTFNTWTLDVIESALFKLKYLVEKFPDFKPVDIEEGVFSIYDKKTKKVITVRLQSGKFVCDADSNAEKYVQFACLHPKFK